jgi:hypothetical protein
MKKEEVIEALRSQGFIPKDNGNNSYSVGFDNLTILYIPDENDETFFRFCLPGIFDVNDENREMVLELINRTNIRMKYSKTAIFGDSVWVFYEAHIWNDSSVEDMIEHCMYMLKATLHLFHSLVEGDESDMIDKDEKNNEE